MRILVIGEARASVATCLVGAGHVVTPGRPVDLLALGPLHDLVLVEVSAGGVELGSLARARAAGLRTAVVVLLDGDIEDRVRGLDAGADDCLSRPVAPEELRARIQAARRRSPARQVAALPSGEATAARPPPRSARRARRPR